MITVTLEHHAMLFADIAREAIVCFGNKGESAILEGIRRYGERRGKRMAERTGNDHVPNDLVAYLVYSEIDTSLNTLKIIQKTPYLHVNVTDCAWYKTWQKFDVIKYGCLYCRVVDDAILQGFNPEFRFAVNGTLSNGGDHCEFHYYDGSMNWINGIRYYWMRRQVGNLARRSFAFHIADLYDALSTILIERFGEMGKQAVDSALSKFQQQFGFLVPTEPLSKL